MSTEKIVITLFAKDSPGIVRKVSDAVLENDGNWLESSLSRLCGQFAGIVHIAINSGEKAGLIGAFAQLESDGIHITVQDSSGLVTESEEVNALQILVEANDRPGIVEEISAVLAQLQVNVESMDTECESASMAGYSLFRAHMFLALPESLTEDDLEQALEKVSDDLMVSVLDE
ncbi:MAG: glycine cleavage system regulatory protein [Cryomorphaceae bacterium]|jgi:glycine cleavage system regulatory protein